MLHAFDYVLILAFLLATVILGVYYRGKQGTPNDYFISKGSLRGVLGSGIIGLSITATFFSGISFLGYPSVVINHGLVIIAGASSTFILQYFLVIHFFAPRFTQVAWSAPYEILEQRFGKPTRKITSVLYILMRLGWMAALIYAPSIAILGATGLGMEYFWPVILLVGLTSTFYSALGGLRGIMITDALQMLVIMGGSLITVGFILYFLPVPFATAWSWLEETDKLRLTDFSLDTSLQVTTWSAAAGTFFATVGMYFGDQMSLQRYMTSESRESLKQSFLINIIGVIGILCLLGIIGVSLAAWFQFNPSDLLPQDSDQIFPFFVASELPVGIAGLIIAALLSATMSSTTSGINALAGAIQMDLLPQLIQKYSDRARLKLARSLSFGLGILATLCTGLVSQLGQIFDIAQKLLGVFLGPIAMCFIFAVLPLKMARGSVMLGLLGGSGIGLLAALSPQLNEIYNGYPIIPSLWTAPITITTAFVLMALGIRGTHKTFEESLNYGRSSVS